MIRILTWVGLLLCLSACATIPSSAPTVGQVVNAKGGEQVDVREITPALAAQLIQPQPYISNWQIGDAPPLWDSISVGDTITISIFEIGYGLFTPGGSTAEGPVAPRATGRVLAPITIPESGLIDLPYIGPIRASGLSAAGLTTEIERRLKGKSQFAQALVTLERGSARSVIVSGDVKQPGRLLLTASEERLLDAIALAGGAQSRVGDIVVRLSRGGMMEQVRLDGLTPNSTANVRLGPGDRIELVRSVRTFSVLGAAKTVSEIPFDGAQLTLIEALSRAGGPTDDKADATGVFIFRYEDNGDGNSERPVIYRLNLLHPQSYFAAQRFLMREKDVMLIANARSNQIGKFVQLLNGLTAPAVLLDVVTR
jgi:polysaccharide biosynthesis/export protein